MTFFPDGETHIPSQTPVPGSGRTPEAPEDQTRRRSRLLLRTTMINAVLLAIAILLGYVFPISDEPSTALTLVLVAAVLGALHMAAVLLREQHRTAASTPAGGTRQSQDAPVAAPYGRVDGVQDATVAAPYGVVGGIQDAPTGSFSMTVQDVFTITGRGTVATGRISSGQLRVGQDVQVHRAGVAIRTVEVTAIEMLRRMAEVAQPGDDVGVLLRGISRDEIRSGDLLLG